MMDRWRWTAIALIAGLALLPFVVLGAVIAYLLAGPVNRPGQPVRAVLSSDGGTLYSDVVDRSEACIASRKLTDWDAGWTILSRGARNPQLSRDGKKLVFERPLWSSTEILIHDLASGEAKSIADLYGDAEVKDVDWTGGRVVVESTESNLCKAAPPHYFVLVDAAGGTLKRLPGDACFIDQERLVIANDRAGGLEIQGPDGGFKPLRGLGRTPISSHDGATVVYSTGSRWDPASQEWKRIEPGEKEDAAVGRIKAPVFLQESTNLLGISPDDRSVVLHYDSKTGKMRKVASLDPSPDSVRSSLGGTVVVCEFRGVVQYLLFDEKGVQIQRLQASDVRASR